MEGPDERLQVLSIPAVVGMQQIFCSGCDNAANSCVLIRGPNVPKKGHQELFLLRAAPPLLFLPHQHTDGPMLPSIIQRVVMPADPRLHP